MQVSDTTPSIDFSPYLAWDPAPPIPFADAVARIRTYCTDPRSGWGVYDLAAAAARAEGAFESVGPWSLLLANALNGQVQLDDVAGFDLARREEFARRLSAIPVEVDLADMDQIGRDAVVNACAFGYKFGRSGVWGPKITKVGALYRPRSIPVLDGYVAMAFGLSAGGFSAAAIERGLARRDRIAAVVSALGTWLQNERQHVAALRSAVAACVPGIATLSDVRLIDIVIWTSQDDRVSRRGKANDRWLDGSPSTRIDPSDFRSVPV